MNARLQEDWYCPNCAATDGAGCGACPNWPQRRDGALAPDASANVAPGAVRPLVRTFGTGATRDLDDSKLDYEAYFSPAVLDRFAQYMHGKQRMADGSVRAGDNWQKGIPHESYVKSLLRHAFDVWKLHRGLPASEDEETALCAVMFNAMGKLHEVLKAKGAKP